MQPRTVTVDGQDNFIYYNAEGQVHRVDGPAVEHANGTREWWVNDRRHRLDGPAIEYTDGSQLWYFNGALHRTDGPAIEHSSGYRAWYVNDKQLTRAEFEALVGQSS